MKILLKIKQLFCKHRWVRGVEKLCPSFPMSDESYLAKKHNRRIILYGCENCLKVKEVFER